MGFVVQIVYNLVVREIVAVTITRASSNPLPLTSGFDPHHDIYFRQSVIRFDLRFRNASFSIKPVRFSCLSTVCPRKVSFVEVFPDIVFNIVSLYLRLTEHERKRKKEMSSVSHIYTLVLVHSYREREKERERESEL